MYRCLICRFDVTLDDAVAPTRRGTCLCIGCYARETGDSRRVSKLLVREVEAVLAA